MTEADATSNGQLHSPIASYEESYGAAVSHSTRVYPSPTQRELAQVILTNFANRINRTSFAKLIHKVLVVTAQHNSNSDLWVHYTITTEGFDSRTVQPPQPTVCDHEYRLPMGTSWKDALRFADAISLEMVEQLQARQISEADHLCVSAGEFRVRGNRLGPALAAAAATPL